MVQKSNNKKLVSSCLGINSKNIYRKSTKEAKDLAVKKQIEEVFRTHSAYGHRRLAFELRMNKKKVRRIMKKFNLKPPRLWYQKTYLTKPNKIYQDRFSNLIKEIKCPRENEVWAEDLTYLRFKDMFVYLSAVCDIANNEVVAYNLGSRHNSNLVLKTIQEGIEKYHQPPRIFHFDRGTENLNEQCLKFLKDNHIQVSVSDPGCPWQNGHAESFFSRFKSEAGDLSRFEDLGELTEYIYHYINYYNHDRIVTRLKTSPIKYRFNHRMCS